MPLQKISQTKTKTTTTNRTVAYGGAAKEIAKPAVSHASKIVSGTDVAICPYCGQAMRR